MSADYNVGFDQGRGGRAADYAPGSPQYDGALFQENLGRSKAQWESWSPGGSSTGGGGGGGGGGEEIMLSVGVIVLILAAIGFVVSYRDECAVGFLGLVVALCFGKASFDFSWRTGPTIGLCLTPLLIGGLTIYQFCVGRHFEGSFVTALWAQRFLALTLLGVVPTGYLLFRDIERNSLGWRTGLKCATCIGIVATGFYFAPPVVRHYAPIVQPIAPPHAIRPIAHRHHA